jgi:hypothetical protein
MRFAAAGQEITKTEHLGVSVESSVLCEDTIDVDMDAIDFVAQTAEIQMSRHRKLSCEVGNVFRRVRS